MAFVFQLKICICEIKAYNSYTRTCCLQIVIIRQSKAIIAHCLKNEKRNINCNNLHFLWCIEDLLHIKFPTKKFLWCLMVFSDICLWCYLSFAIKIKQNRGLYTTIVFTIETIAMFLFSMVVHLTHRFTALLYIVLYKHISLRTNLICCNLFRFIN